MMQLFRWIEKRTAIATFLLISACQQIPPPSNQNPPPQTRLETSTPPPVSTVETQPVAASKVETVDSIPKTQTSVEQVITDLQAQTAPDGSKITVEKTGEGLLVNLPENILFDFDKSEIRPDAKTTLTKVNELLQSYKNAPVTINGHTDSKGSEDYNLTLSEKRSQAVKEYLQKNFKVSEARLEAKGFGETKPVVPNNNPDGSDNPANRQKNRRVEILIRQTSSGVTQ
jgi:outer membrane protein OmpA-like peptidoglycan-associated protein